MPKWQLNRLADGKSPGWAVSSPLSAVCWKVEIFELRGHGKLTILSRRIHSEKIFIIWLFDDSSYLRPGSLLDSRFVADFWRSKAVFREKVNFDFFSITKGLTPQDRLTVGFTESLWSNLVSVVSEFSPRAGAVYVLGETRFSCLSPEIWRRKLRPMVVTLCLQPSRIK